MAFKWTTDDGGGLMILTLTHAYLLHLRLFMSKQLQQQQQALFVGPYKYIQYCKSYLLLRFKSKN